MTHTLCFLMLFISLLGCASSYNLSKEGIAYRASLTDAAALDVVKKYATKSDEQAGVCSAHTNDQFMRAEPGTVDGLNLVFTSFYTVMTGVNSRASVSAGTVTTSIAKERRKGTFKINLRELNRIRVLDDVASFGCDRSLRGHIVMIDNKGVGDVAQERPAAVMINVSAKNLDHFVAALTFLSPNASVVHGAGL